MSTDGRRLRVGVLSTADIGLKKVIPGMRTAPHVEVAAIASRDGDRARAAADRLGIPRAHDSYEALLADPDIRGTPDPPRRVADSALREARRPVTEATYRFLVRCCNDGLIPESRLRSLCNSLGIGVDAADLRRK